MRRHSRWFPAQAGTPGSGTGWWPSWSHAAVVPVELSAGDESAGLTAYAGTVVTAIADRAPVVLVAQSMGGLTAPLVCDRVGVQRLVLLNAMVPRPGETGGDWWRTTGQAEAQAEYLEGVGVDGGGDAVTFFHDVPEDITAVAMRRELAQSMRPFEDPWPLDAWPDVPTRVLTGRDDRLFPAHSSGGSPRSGWGWCPTRSRAVTSSP